MRKSSLLLLLAAFFLLPGCKPKKADIAEWQQFQDDYFRVTFTYPKDWVVVKETNKVIVYSSADAAQKFFDHDERKPDGIQLIIAAEPGKTGGDAGAYIENHRSEQKGAGFTVKDVEQTKIEGLSAAQVTYSGIFDDEKKVKLVTTRSAAVKDSVIYYLQYAAFNDLFEPYRSVYDTLVASISLPKKVVIPKGVDPAIPLADVRKYGSDVLTLEFPANFGVSDVAKKGEVTYAIKVLGNIDGSRQDCAIDLDVRPAKKLTVDKVAEQNAKIFKPTSRGEAKIGDHKAVFFNYTPAGVKNVKSRVYFMVKDDKFYRVIFNYYSPMEKSFLPAFEKVVASIRIK